AKPYRNQAGLNVLDQRRPDGAGKVGLDLPLQGELPGDEVLVLPAELTLRDHEAAGDRPVGVDDTREPVDERLFALHEIPPSQAFETVVQTLTDGRPGGRPCSNGAAPAPLELLHTARHDDTIVVAAEVRQVTDGVERRLLLVDENARLQTLEA